MSLQRESFVSIGLVGSDVDLVRNPDLAMRPEYCRQVPFGMVEGWFTGRKLIDYFKGTRSDWVDAGRSSMAVTRLS